MADDPRDDLISGTLSLDEAAPRLPALPFGEQARRPRGPVSEAPPPPSVPRAPPASASWPTPPAYAAPPPMPSAMPQIVARAGGMQLPGVAPPSVGVPAPLGGAYAFSNAAAAAHDRGAADARPATPVRSARERVDYLWHDTQAEAAIGAVASIEDEATNVEEDWLPDAEADRRAAVHGVLRKQLPTPLEDLVSAYADALDHGGRPLHRLVQGELVLAYDPLDALRVTLSVATPHLSDARVKDAHDAAQEALRAPAGVASAVAAHHKERLDEALKTALRAAVAPLETVVERALVEGRALARRRVFGGHLVRALLHPVGRAAGAQGSSGAVPVYLADAAADALPLMSRVPVRLVVEVRPAQDASEAHPLALRAVALGRLVELGARGR